MRVLVAAVRVCSCLGVPAGHVSRVTVEEGGEQERAGRICRARMRVWPAVNDFGIFIPSV